MATKMDAKTEQAILAADKARIAAVLGRNRAGLEAVMSDDLVYVHSSGPQEDKATYIDRIVSGHYQYKSFDIVSRSMHLIDGLVFDNGDNKVDIVRSGDLHKLAGRFLMVWRQEQGKWRLLRFHAAPIPRT